jgi:opacity protein-like surface antigen
MKKIFLLSLSALFFLSSPLLGTELGSFYVGVKYWYTYWNSGALEWFDSQLVTIYNDWGVPTTVDTKPGTGFLSGPIFGYQTRDGKWNISYAPMIFNHSSQKQTTTQLGNFNEKVITDVDMYRRDFDLAVSYSLSDFNNVSPYFDYCKLFAGFKHQVVDLDVNAQGYTNGVENDNYSIMKMRYVAQMPTVGFGIAYPLTNKLVLGFQGGIGIVLIDQEESEIYVNEAVTEIRPDNSFSYNAEVGLNIVPANKLIVQIGYRYQQWKFSIKNKQDFATSDDSMDVTHGPSFALVYAF